MYQYESLRELLESKGFPDGRTIKHDDSVVSMVMSATSFLPEDVKISQRLLCVEQRWAIIPKCEVCGNDNVFSRKKLYSDHYNGWSRCCSSECSRKSTKRMERTRDTMVERYGVMYSGQSPELLKKSRDTMMELYGSEYALQSEGFKNKFTETMSSRYGVEYSLQSHEIYQKAQNSWLERYGVRTPLENPDIAEKRCITWERKYNGHPAKFHYTDDVDSLLQSKEHLESHYHEFKSSDLGASDLGISATTYKYYLKNHGIEILKGSHSSSYELDICKFLDSHGLKYETSDRKILDGLECDIVVEGKLIIEFNGLYWHSDKFKPKNYHQHKSTLSHTKGYGLIHVWEDDWLNKRSIIESKILSKCGVGLVKVYARKCSIKELSNSDAIEFYNNHHIQGHINASKVYGLIYDGNLVAAISFKKLPDGGYDLIRYATSKNVVGGFSKLLKFFKNNNEFDYVTTFASLDYGNGDVYRKNGFREVSVTRPNYWYIKGGVRYSRQTFMKHKLESKLKSFNPLLSENDNMKLNGFLKVYDSGSIKFIMDE